MAVSSQLIFKLTNIVLSKFYRYICLHALRSLFLNIIFMGGGRLTPSRGQNPRGGPPLGKLRGARDLLPPPVYASACAQSVYMPQNSKMFENEIKNCQKLKVIH